MIQLRKANERGDANHGWLKSRHTFSFADYYDPQHVGFGSLRVINEDRIQGGSGFGTHPHEDMEIISYVVEGALKHKDSIGNETTIRPGEVQRMSAGTGVRHSEYNLLKDQVTHFLQIWIVPERTGIEPGYGQKSFENQLAGGEMVLVASHSGRSASITIHQDVDMYVLKARDSGEMTHTTSPQRYLWVQVIQGPATVDGMELESGDGAAIQDVHSLRLQWEKGTQLILFDMR